jgi:hypothetical protein
VDCWDSSTSMLIPCKNWTYWYSSLWKMAKTTN